MNQKLSFPDIVEQLAQVTNSSKRVCELFLKELFATISQALIDGQNVRIKGIGSFKLTSVGQRNSIDVNTGEEIEIPPHTKVVFMPDKALAEAINEPFAHFESVELSEELSDELLSRAGDEAPLSDDASAGIAVPTDETQDVAESEMATPPPFTKFAQVESLPCSPGGDDMAELAAAEPEPELESEPFPEPEPAPFPESELAPIPETEPQPESDAGREKAPQHHEAATSPSSNGDSESVAEKPLYSENELRSFARKSLFKGFIWGALVALFICMVVFYLAYPKVMLENNNAGEKAQVTAAADTVSSTETTASEDAIATAKVEEKPAVVLDTLTAQMVLFRMARKHYGEPHFWVYIYQENRDKIKDPNNVNPGTVVVIPPAEKYGIDPNSKESVDKAKVLSYEILSRY